MNYSNETPIEARSNDEHGSLNPKPRNSKELIIKDDPGELEWIDKTLLKVDEAYQRNTSNEKVWFIAREWSWVACGAIIVAKRMGTGFFIIDGQHRVLAAQERSDIDKLPCIVFQVDSVINEAEGFLGANSKRKPLTAVDKYKAMLVTRDPRAVMVESLLNAANRSMSKNSGPNTVSCAHVLIEAAEHKRDALITVWPIFSVISLDKPMSGNMLKALVYIQHKLKNDSLNEQRWIRKLTKTLGHDRLQTVMRQAALQLSHNSAKSHAIGIVGALNKNTNKPLDIEFD